MVITSIRHNLTGLVRFSGRDGPRLFWPYAFCVFGLVTIVSTVAVLPEFFAAFARMQAFAVAHPDQADVAVGPGFYSITVHGDHPELMPNVTGFVKTVCASVAVMIVFLAAAVARRLHDRGRTAFWGLCPIPSLVIGLVGFSRLFASFDSATFPVQTLLLLFANNVIYLAILGLLMWQLILPTSLAPNRFGPPGDLTPLS